MNPTVLARAEAVIDASGVATSIESLLAVGVRPRQLRVRTLLVGMLAAADGRPAHLRRVHAALIDLKPTEQIRLGVIDTWKTGPHVLTYRQVEYTFAAVVAALSKDVPDGAPGQTLAETVDTLLEASIPDDHKQTTAALAVDWSDLESWALAPHSDGVTADPEASWGHRASHAIGVKDELFYGYYLQAATMVADDDGPATPELARRVTLSSCDIDPPRAFVPVLERLAATGVAIGDVLADSGYAHRTAPHWALPLRALGASIVTDLHPSDRGPKGTHAGAIIANGRLYCPATPEVLLHIDPLARAASAADTADHDRRTAETARYKLGPITATDADGYQRVTCPAITGKLRCPLRPASMTLPHTHPEILNPPRHPPTCCEQQTITVGAQVAAKTAQRHDYPSKPWRTSYARRTAAERTFSTVKDPASTDINRGWCRIMGLTAISLFVACAFVTRNQRVADAFDTKAAENARRAANGQPARTRRRRRKTIADLVAAAPANAPP